MNYRNFGRTGAHVSELCLGCGNFGGRTDESASAVIIDKAIDAGINFLDTADAYNNNQSEETVGKALKSNRKRNEVFLATKFCKWIDNGRKPNKWGLSRKYIIEACDASLRRLQTDYIDLYQIHRPFWDVAVDETLRALDDLIRAGKVRYIGTSNYSAWEIMETIWASKELGLNRIVSEQPPYNLLNRRIEQELIPFAQTYGMAVIVWSPLANGFFSGKYQRGKKPPEDARIQEGHYCASQLSNEKAYDVLDVVMELAKEKGCTPSQIALSWVNSRPGITSPIIGPRNLEQLEDNLKATNILLTGEDLKRIDSVIAHGEVISPYGFMSQPHQYRW